MNLSEDDIRTKVVYEWLKDCGFSLKNIFLEYSLEVHFGKTTKTFRPRTDVLVKSDSGKNLLIIEVKSPDHDLSNDDINQAISYALLLKDGVAPFTILTNGTDSRLFDSVTREEINNSSIPINHKYVLNGFKPTTDGINSKIEAAEYLVSLSANNLKTFCKQQVEDRISILKGYDVKSGKKYIPCLYVDRKKAKTSLRQKLFIEKNNLVLIIGNPQQGKTCFICSTVDSLLEDGYLCLFYPAISLRTGLISAIKEDFNWCFGDNLSIIQLIQKVDKICKKINKKVYIFIDGWDEMANDALKLNEECKKLFLENVSIVISLTIPSLGRLLIDEADNLTFIGSNSGLSKDYISSLGYKPLKKTDKINIVQIESYSEKETVLAKEKYQNAFDIEFMPTDNVFSDPFYLRVICELYSKKKIPKNLSRTEIIRKYISLKAKRRGLRKVKLEKTLVKLGELFYEYGRPVDFHNIANVFDDDIEITPWEESGILVIFDHELIPKIDFYNSNILHFSIAIYKKWSFLLNSNEIDIKKELENIFEIPTREEAFLWFLSCPENSALIQKIFQIRNTQSNLSLLRLLTNAIMRQKELNNLKDFSWLEGELIYMLDENENEVTYNDISALIYTVLKSVDIENDFKEYKHWIRQLLKNDNSETGFDILNSYISLFYGELYSYDGYQESSGLDTDLFFKLIFDEDIEVAKQAAYYYSYSCFMSYLEKFESIKKGLVGLNHNVKSVLKKANRNIAHFLGDSYYGHFCKGWLLESEKCDKLVKEEFYKMNKLLPNIIETHPNTDLAETLTTMLKDLKYIGCVNDEDIDINYENPNQLNLDL